jgi:hypothetical protein
MKKVVFIFFLISSWSIYGLEIDEKLPLRLLKTSRSKKTILINRGVEDGLASGDHAKFFLTKGVIARGVVIKTSPTRSVWSLYRVIDAAEIEPDRVMNLKISSPVKLTDDPSKMLSHEDLPQYNTGRIKYYNNTSIPYYQGRVAPVYKGEPVPSSTYAGVPVVKGGVDIDQEELEALENGSSPSNDSSGQEGGGASGQSEVLMGDDQWNAPARVSTNDWEFNLTYSLSSLSTSVESKTGTGDFSGSVSPFDFTIGLEKYFSQTKKWWRQVSLGAHVHKAKQDTFNEAGTVASKIIESEADVTEFGLNLSYHLSDPFWVSKLIFFGQVATGIGSTSDTFAIADSEAINATSSFFSVGLGGKYLLRSGLGMKGLLDYYRRSETFKFDQGGDITRVVSGPRVGLGLFYRW